MLVCMRTTVVLDDDLYAEVKQVAARRGQTITATIEDALRESLARRVHAAKQPPLELPTFRGTGLAPGVDLDDSAGLLDLMESDADPD